MPIVVLELTSSSLSSSPPPLAPAPSRTGSAYFRRGPGRLLEVLGADLLRARSLQPRGRLLGAQTRGRHARDQLPHVGRTRRDAQAPPRDLAACHRCASLSVSLSLSSRSLHPLLVPALRPLLILSRPLPAARADLDGLSLQVMSDMTTGTGRGWKSTFRVRMLHAQVRRRIANGKGRYNVYDEAENGVPINQADLLAVLGAFMIAPMWSLRRMGIKPTPREEAAYQTTWRHIGCVPPPSCSSTPARVLPDAPLSRPQLLPRHLARPPLALLRPVVPGRRGLLCVARLLDLPRWRAAERPAQHAAVQDPVGDQQPPAAPDGRPAPRRAVPPPPRPGARRPARPPARHPVRPLHGRRRDVDGVGSLGVRAGVRARRRRAGPAVGDAAQRLVPIRHRARRCVPPR